MLRILSLLISIFFLTSSILAQDAAKQKLTAAEVIEQPIKTIVYFPQPLDHFDENSREFYQKIEVIHRGIDRPVVMITEGYSIYSPNLTASLAERLGANEIRIEHRFFGRSVPDTLNWSKLNVKQACEDYHRIREYYGDIYQGDWISAGWSKGGQTSLIYKMTYPDDLSGVVAFDAPLNFSTAEQKVDAFFDTVATKKCRKNLIKFQREVLEQKETVLPIFEAFAKKKNFIFPEGYEKALEYMVLEYPFSFWQYHHLSCDEIPLKSDPNTLFEHLTKVVSAWSYSQGSYESPSMFQFYSELGYYEYVRKNVEDLLKFKSHPNAAFAPKNAKLKYSNQYAKDLNEYLENDGDNIVYIYGNRDPWSAPAITPNPDRNSKRFDLLLGNHYTFINEFPKGTQKQIMEFINSWIGK